MTVLPPLTLVLGGASSGKSGFAERLVKSAGGQRVYLATAQPFDDEMRAKIAAHREERAQDGWVTVEEPFDLSPALSARTSGDVVLVDCATMWLTNQVLSDRDVEAETARLLACFASSAAPIVCVSNEVGHGIVPENAMARQFRVHQGGLNCRIAAQADLVVMVQAGLPSVLKGELP